MQFDHLLVLGVVAQQRLAEGDEKDHLEPAQAVRLVLADLDVPVHRVVEREDVVPLLAAPPGGRLDQGHAAHELQVRRRDVRVQPEDFDHPLDQPPPLRLHHGHGDAAVRRQPVGGQVVEAGADRLVALAGRRPLAGVRERLPVRFGQGFLSLGLVEETGPVQGPEPLHRPGQGIRVVLDDPAQAQLFTREDARLDRAETERLHPAAVDVDRLLVLQGVALQHRAGDIAHVERHHVREQVVHPAGDVAVVGADQVGDVEFPVRGVAGGVGLAGLHPDVGHQHLEGAVVAAHRRGQAGHLEDGDDRGVQAARREQEDIRLAHQLHHFGVEKGGTVELDQHPVHRVAAGGPAGLFLAGDKHAVAVEHLQLRQGGGAGQDRLRRRAEADAQLGQAADGGGAHHLVRGEQFGAAERAVELPVDGAGQQQVAQALRPLQGGREPRVVMQPGDEFPQKRQQRPGQIGKPGPGVVEQLVRGLRRGDEAVIEDGVQGRGRAAGLVRVQAVFPQQVVATDRGDEHVAEVAQGDKRQVFLQLAGGAAVVGDADHRVDPRKHLLQAGERSVPPVRSAGVAADDVGQAGAAAEHHHPGGARVQGSHLFFQVGEQGRDGRGKGGGGAVEDNGGDLLGQAVLGEHVEHGKTRCGQAAELFVEGLPFGH